MYYNKKVSVITLTNNSAHLLASAFISFAYQNYENMEWLIVDNASTDGTLNLVRGFQSVDKRIRLITTDKPKTLNQLYNDALQNVTGDYIAFLEAEDVWVKNKIQRQLGFAVRYSANICHSSFAYIDDNCDVLPVGCAHIEPVVNLVNYRKKANVCLSTVMLKTVEIQKYLPLMLRDKKGDVFMYFMRKGLASQGISDVLSLCRLRFGPPTHPDYGERIKSMEQQIKKENKKFPSTVGYDAYKAKNVADIKLNPSSCIGRDVYVSMDDLKKINI